MPDAGQALLSILADFVVAVIVYYFSMLVTNTVKAERDRAYKERDEIQKRFDDLQHKYTEDLRDWSGLNPRPQTWLSESSPVWKRSNYGYNKENPEGDTRRFPSISEQERAQWVKDNAEV